MYKMLLLTLFLIVFTISGFSQIETDSLRAVQYDSNPQYRSNLLGIGTTLLKNSYLSPLSLKAFSMAYRNSRMEYKNWGVKELSFYFSTEFGSDFFSEKYDMIGDYMAMNIGFNYFLNKLVHRNENMFFYVGGGCNAEMLLGSRLGAGFNQLSVNARLNTMPKAMYVYRFSVKKHRFDFTQTFAFPLLGIAVLPKYGSMFYNSLSDNESNDIGVNLVFTSLHNHFGITTESYIDWRRLNENGQERKSFLRFGFVHNSFYVNTETIHQRGTTQFVVGALRKF